MLAVALVVASMLTAAGCGGGGSAPATTVTTASAATTAPTTTAPTRAALAAAYLRIVDPCNKETDKVNREQKAWTNKTPISQAAKEVAPLSRCYRTEIDTLLRTPWDPATRDDVKALVTAGSALASDFDSLSQQTSLTINDWGAQVQRDEAQAGTAANIVRSDLGLPPNN